MMIDSVQKNHNEDERDSTLALDESSSENLNDLFNEYNTQDLEENDLLAMSC